MPLTDAAPYRHALTHAADAGWTDGAIQHITTINPSTLHRIRTGTTPTITTDTAALLDRGLDLLDALGWQHTLPIPRRAPTRIARRWLRALYAEGITTVALARHGINRMTQHRIDRHAIDWISTDVRLRLAQQLDVYAIRTRSGGTNATRRNA